MGKTLLFMKVRSGLNGLRKDSSGKETTERLEEACKITDLLHKAREVLLSSNIQSRQALKLNIIAHHGIITTQRKSDDVDRRISLLEASYGIVPPAAKPKTRTLAIVPSKELQPALL